LLNTILHRTGTLKELAWFGDLLNKCIDVAERKSRHAFLRRY